jgi:hypothetical protein
LATQGFPQDWLGDIYSSLACSFSPNTLWAGVFVHAGEYGRDQPPIKFFCEFEVPVWYPWGLKQKTWAQEHPCFVAYSPLPHRLQAATTTLVQSPTQPPCLSEATMPVDHSTSTSMKKVSQPPCSSEATMPVDRSTSTSTKKVCQTWQDFFAARDKHHAEMEKHESPLSHQKCLDQEQKLPIKCSKVFQ